MLSPHVDSQNINFLVHRAVETQHPRGNGIIFMILAINLRSRRSTLENIPVFQGMVRFWRRLCEETHRSKKLPISLRL